VDVIKRHLRRTVHRDIFTVSRVAKKKDGRDSLVRLLDAPPPSLPKSSDTVKSILCIRDVIL
jgi:hypothetical protein